MVVEFCKKQKKIVQVKSFNLAQGLERLENEFDWIEC